MILTSIEPNFLPILKPLANYGIVTLHQQHNKMLLDADIEARFIGDLVDQERRAASITQLVEYITSITQQPVVTTELAPQVAKWLSANLPVYFYQRLENILNIYATLTNLQPGLLLVHNDVEPITRLLALWAKNHQRPCLHVPHAIYLDNEGRGPLGSDVHDLVTASHIAVAGPYQAEWYSQRGMPDNSIYITGLPQFDRLAKMEMTRERAAFLLRLNPNLPIIVYKSSWRQDTNLLGCHDGVEENYQLFLETAKRMPDLQYVVSCHPRGGNLVWHKQLLEASGVRAVITQDHLDVILAAADILICYGPSNVVLEAATFRRPQLIVMGDAKAFPHDHEVIKCPSSNQALEQIIIESLRTGPPNYDNFIHKYLGIMDGRATERIVALAKELHG